MVPRILDKTLATPVIAGLAIGIATIVVFASYSDFYNTPTPISSPQVESNLHDYNVTVGSKGYLVEYHFASQDAKLLNMTADPVNLTLKASVDVPTYTTLELSFPYGMRKALFSSGQQSSDFDLVIFADTVQVSVNETSTKPETSLSMILDKGTSVIEILGTRPL